VSEQQGGTSNVSFGYRVVAKRKDDVGKRMEKVQLPKFNLGEPERRGRPEP
jgi:hypothetical protein